MKEKATAVLLFSPKYLETRYKIEKATIDKMVNIIAHRISNSKYIDEFVLLTDERSFLDNLNIASDGIKVKKNWGDSNPFKRIINYVDNIKSDYLVRLTVENFIIDWRFIDYLLEFINKQGIAFAKPIGFPETDCAGFLTGSVPLDIIDLQSFRRKMEENHINKEEIIDYRQFYYEVVNYTEIEPMKDWKSKTFWSINSFIWSKELFHTVLEKYEQKWISLNIFELQKFFFENQSVILDLMKTNFRKQLDSEGKEYCSYPIEVKINEIERRFGFVLKEMRTNWYNNSSFEEESARKSFEEVLACFKQWKITEGIQKTEGHLKKFPKDVNAILNLIIAHSMRMEFDNVSRQLDLAFELDPSVKIIKLKGKILTKWGYLNKAFEILKQAEKKWPDDKEIALLIGNILLINNLPDKARDYYEKALPHRSGEINLTIINVRLLKDDKPTKEYIFNDNCLNNNDIQPGDECKASIIIPVYNKLEFTKQCLGGIFHNTKGIHYEIIIVDNASNDDTPSFLKTLKGVKVVSNEVNLGFVEACNKGADVAIGKYLIFLNNDTVPEPGWLNELVKTAEEDNSIGAVGAKLKYPNGMLQEAGGIIWNDGTGWNYGRGENPADPEFNFLREVDYCSGACLLVPKDLFNIIGGFDMRYAPAYAEDADLCFEIRKRGFKVVYNPHVGIVHFEGATAGIDTSSGMKRYQLINQNKFKEKWKGELKKQYSPNVDNVAKASDRRKGKLILIIDPLLPWYDKASGSLRLFKSIEILIAQGYKVTFIARNGSKQEKYKLKLEKMGVKVYATDPDKMRQLGAEIQAPKVDMQKVLTTFNYDVAILSFFEIAEQYLNEIREYSPNTFVIIDTVDVHYLRETRKAELSNDSTLMLKAKETKARELKIYPKADLVLTVTEDDKKVLKDELPELPVMVMPNIHDVLVKTNPYTERKDLLFIGNFNHNPNIDAIQYFYYDIWPLVKQKIPNIKLYVVGNRSDELFQVQDEDVIITGFVPDTQPYLQSCKISISPLRYGAGMKGKVGEAMMSGIPVVTTSIGAEGMGLVNGKHVMVADTEEDFAEAIEELYWNEDLWNSLIENSKRHINKNYSSEAVAKRWDKIISIAVRD